LSNITGTPVFDREPPTVEQCSSRVVLLGDAAHPMSPFKGQGANQALLDACLLASLLSSSPVPEAIQEYQRQMCARTTAQVLSSRACVGRLHSEGVLSSAEWGNQRGLDMSNVTAARDRVGAWCGQDIEAALKLANTKTE